MIAILGTGKMGEALLSGLLRAGRAPAAVVAAVRREDRGAELRERYGIQVTDAASAAKLADTLVLAVKPQDMGKLLAEIAPAVPPDRLVVSVAAGITTAFIERRLDGEVPVVRVMSNTPVLVDEAMSVISAGSYAGEEHLRRAEELFRPVGKVLRIPESQQDAATALSGSGPAYVYYLVESMVDAAILLGTARAAALEMVTQAVYGAATMLRESGEHPVILREAVTSPGGTTIAAIRKLERHGVRDAFLAAIEAARDRGRELDRGRIGAEFPAAVAGRLDGGQERGPHPVPFELPDRGDRGAARRGDRLAQDHRMLARFPQHGGRAVDRLGDHLQRGAAGHAEQDGRVHHRLDQVVDVRGAAAGQRGRRVLLRFGDAQHLAHRAEQVLGPAQVLLARVRPGRDHAHRLVHQDRGVRHDPDDRHLPVQPPLDERRGDPGRRRDHQPVRRYRGRDLGQQLAHVLRLDRQDQRAGQLGGRRGVGHLDPVPLPELGAPVLAADRGDQGRRRQARAQQAGQQRLAHLAGAQDRDHDLLPSERRKKARLPGRSASLRTR